MVGYILYLVKYKNMFVFLMSSRFQLYFYSFWCDKLKKIPIAKLFLLFINTLHIIYLS
jgi:hypothetical protein